MNNTMNTIDALNALTIRNEANKFPISKSSQAYKMVKAALETGKPIRPCYAQGSGKFSGNADHTSAVCIVLNRLGIAYELTNDAPRGGKQGNLITIK